MIRSVLVITLGLANISVGQQFPDVLPWDLESFANYGPSKGYRAYALGTRVCNNGDVPLYWQANTNLHPLIVQNMYRWKDGRFEQIGMSWATNDLYALSFSDCGPCQATDGTTLGISCSTYRTASLNAEYSNFGCRSLVNATTGYFPFPQQCPDFSDPTARRCRVLVEDVLPSNNSDAAYFFEAQYVCVDDSPDDTGDSSNNVAHRGLNFTDEGALASFNGGVIRGRPAIESWANLDSEVELQQITIEGEGTIWFGCRVFNEGNGSYRYEYAIYNQDFDRSIRSLRLPWDLLSSITSTNHFSPDWHSGEVTSNEEWNVETTDQEITWSTDSFDDDPDANSVRWGTLHNISLIAEKGPIAGDAALGIFKVLGNQSSTITIQTIIPGPACGDCDNDGINDCAEIENGTAIDLNNNGVDDNCDPDCDGDGVPDFQEIAAGAFDCDLNSIPDSCQIADDPSLDVNSNTFIDDCEIDCNQNAVFDFIDLYTGVSQDINDNNVPDECEDCDGDGIPDDSDSDPDCDQNGIPDTCESNEDCNANGTPDICESLPDCNQNGIPDECDIAEGSASDLNEDNIPDSCQCIADVVPNGLVEYSDLITVISNWGPCDLPCPSDIVADGVVGYEDLIQVLSAWGPCSG